MKKILVLLFLSYLPISAQSPSYYNSAQQLLGNDLKNELHEIIKEHNEFSYTSTKNILKLADQDPENENNVILVYKGISISKDDFASNNQQDFWNREHVWVKSQGGFNGDETYGAIGAYSDAHNLKPCDASINSARGTKDFDNGGSPNSEATECNFTSTTWEPRDEVKGDVARIIFYMDARYKGDPGEPNLTVVESINNSSDPLMGRLSTLLEWNEQDPVDAFERRRNQTIFNWQQNRNPFIDYPEFANLIWGDVSLPSINFDLVELSNPTPFETDNQTVSATITSDLAVELEQVQIKWASSWAEIETTNNIMNMVQESGSSSWSASLPDFSQGTDVKYIITANIGSQEKSFYGNYLVAMNPFEGTLTSIQDVQGDDEYSPFENQTISTKGVVTAVMGDDFYMQDGEAARSGMYVYTSPVIPSIGDSVIVTGEVSEFQYDDPSSEKMTELAFPDVVYVLNSNNPIPNPVDISTGDLANEDYEAMLVRVKDVTVTYATFNFDDYGQWRVTDGTGECNIHNTQEGYEYPAEIGEYITSITGVSTYLFGEWKIDLRMEDDVEGGSDTSGPSIIEVQVTSENSIALFFNEDIEIASAENSENYSISNGITVESASRHPFQLSRVNLTTSLQGGGNYVVTATNLTDELGNTSITTQGSYTILGVEEQGYNTLSLFPNPSIGSFIVKGLKAGEELYIVDRLGKIIYQEIPEKPETIFDLKLKQGIYFLQQGGIKISFTIL